MKKITFLLIAALVAMASCNKPSKIKYANAKDSVSYMIGASVGKSMRTNFKSAGFDSDFNYELIKKAFDKAIAGDSIAISEMEMQNKIQTYFMKLQTQAGEKTLKEGKEFLEKNKNNSGVKVLPSGLQYQVIKEGNGPKPDSSDVVNVNYRGTLIDGKEFDNSEKRGGPTKFLVTGVIPGFTQALLMMPVGSKWKLFIPSELGYGERSQNPAIKPNSVLIFELEVLSIEPKKAVEPAKGQPKKK